GALFEISFEEKKDGEILSQVKTLKTVFEENPQFIEVLAAPMISKEEKLALIDNTFKGNVDGYVLNFIKVMLERKAVSLLTESFEAFEEIYNKHYNIEKVVATTAVELSMELRKKLMDKLAATTGKTILLENRVDKDCLGGVVLKFSDTQLDDSIEQKLKAIKAELAKI
ncbi:MAG: ATP synthase F1 subunit delta, partial [Oscillospiraceae bacterium]